MELFLLILVGVTLLAYFYFVIDYFSGKRGGLIVIGIVFSVIWLRLAHEYIHTFASCL